jgi:hypothetical protein
MSLRTSIIEHYKSPQPSKHVENTFQQVSSLNNMPYCSRCGFVGGKLFNVTRHVKSTTNSCSDDDVRPAGGIIKVDKYGFLVPKEILDKISLGSFTLPFNHIDNLNSQSNQSTSINNHPNTNSVYASPPTNDAIKTRFLPTDEDIAATFSTNPPCKDSTSLCSFAQSELLYCFLTEEHANTAHEYLTSFIHLIEQGSPGLLKITLSDYVNKMKSNPTDTNIKLLIISGKKWLQSDSANMDVRMVPVHHRNAMYLVGNTFSENDKDILKGSTFVWSGNMDSIIAQFTSLVKFAYAIKWPTMYPYLTQIGHVYSLTVERGHINGETIDPQEVDDYVAAKIVDTSIIFGLLTEMLLESPTFPNAPTLIYKYLAGATTKLNHQNELSLRNHNEISKSSNALLRLLRHGFCSMYVRRSREMALKHLSHKEFDDWANGVLQEMQVCHSIGHICRTIRTAREVDRKTPSKVYKAFNDRTGELLVGGVQIHKSTWSVAIPTAISEWDKHLSLLFHDHSPGSQFPLSYIYNIQNDIVLADHDSYVSVQGSQPNRILLNQYKPTLTK